MESHYPVSVAAVETLVQPKHDMVWNRWFDTN